MVEGGVQYAGGRFDLADPKGGLLLDDQDSAVTKVIKNMMYKAGKNLLTGRFYDLMKMGTPAFIHHYKTYLHMIVKDVTFMEASIRKAMEKPDDPVHKAKQVVLAQIAAIHLAAEVGTKSPLNPILGETLQMESESGTKIYCEQTSHHPPISHFLIEGPADCAFRIDGHMEYKVEVKGGFQYVNVTMPGKYRIRLPDGTQYTSSLPSAEVTGLMSTFKNLNMIGEHEIVDQTNNYMVRTTFDNQKGNRNEGYNLTRLWKGSDTKDKNGLYTNRRDLLKIEVYKLSEEAEGQLVAEGSGSYLEQITFQGDSEPIWSINSLYKKAQWKVQDGFILPSDSSQRADSKNIMEKEFEEAENSKHEMEELQRADKKLRATAEENRKNGTNSPGLGLTKQASSDSAAY